MTIFRSFRESVLLTFYAMAVSASPAAAQVTFRVVSTLNQLNQPVGLIEGSPGVFYTNALDGANGSEVVFSVTTQGSGTAVAAFPTGSSILAPLVSASSGRFYSSVGIQLNPVSVFSVGSAPGGKRVYPAQDLAPFLTQNLPDGALLGTAVTLTTPSMWYLVKSDLNGGISTIYQFPASESLPAFTAIYGSDGNYYGISMSPQDGSGYVYRITPTGSLTKVWNFPANSFTGASNFAPLL